MKKLLAKTLTYAGDGQQYAATDYPANIIFNLHGASSLSDLFLVINDGESIPEGFTDETSMVNWDKHGDLFGDYIWKQRRIREIFEGKAANEADRWTACSDIEKDVVLNYNQFKTLSGSPEETTKVTYVITSGKAPDLPSASAWLKSVHSKNVGLAKAALNIRMSPDKSGEEKLTKIIVSFLFPDDIDDLLTTINTQIDWLKRYYVRGTIDPNNPVGVYDYVNSTVGTEYELNGLISEGYTTANGQPLSLLVDYMNDLFFGDNEMSI